MSRVIFLDVDGVLNQHKPVGDDMSLKLANWVEPEAMAHLNHIVRETGAVVVLSSTWRIGERLPDLREAFRGVGFEGVLLDKTDNGPCAWHPGLACDEGHRGAEIQCWLDNAREKPEAFVIIDDSADMGPLSEHLIRVRYLNGIEAGLAISRLTARDARPDGEQPKPKPADSAEEFKNPAHPQGGEPR